MTIRVLIADDQAVVRNGFRLMLEPDPDIEVVGDAADGKAAVELAVRRKADVVLMDIRMPGTDGLEATRRLTAETDIDVLAITTYAMDEYIYGALAAGAAGFLLKSVEPADLVAAVHTVAAGNGVVAPEVTRRLIGRFAELLPADESPEPLSELTPREREVLLLVARGLSNQEIADRLVIEPATVKRHVGAMLAKLGLRSRAQAIVLAFRSGLVTPGDS